MVARRYFDDEPDLSPFLTALHGKLSGAVLNANTDDVSAFAFVSLWIWVAAGTFIKITSPKLRVQPVDYSSNLLLSIVATSCLGRALATFNAYETPTLYEIELKDKTPPTVITPVRLVRTSSTGYLVSEERRIAFISKEEVKRVNALYVERAKH